MKNIININNTIGGSKITTLLVPSTSTDEAVVRWDGTSGKSIQNSSVTIDDDGNQKTTNSLTLLTNDANPNGDETLWVNSLDSNKLYFGENKVGDVTSNTIPSINNSLVLFDGLTGKIIKESSIINNIGGINNVRLQSGGQSISYGNNQLILMFYLVFLH